MEHSEEYYKMKYFKYKAKYELLKGGDDEKKDKGFFSKKWNNYQENKSNEEIEKNKQRNQLFKDILDIANNKMNTRNWTKDDFKGITSYKMYKTYIDELYTNGYTRDDLINRAKLCSSFISDTLNDECKTLPAVINNN